jgi:hypothetical protein
MQKKILFHIVILFIISSLKLDAQNEELVSTSKKWFIGSTLLELGNFIPNDENPPEFVQLNVGYRITPKDVVSFRFKRSIYAWPLGIPFGPSFDKPGLNLPGKARIIGPALGYQRFLWKGAYTSLYAMSAFEKYTDLNKKKIGNGYTLYLDYYLGYQFKLFNNRFFIEPAIGISYWPIRSNIPASFKAAEKAWPNYFIQPGFDFGVNF